MKEYIQKFIQISLCIIAVPLSAQSLVNIKAISELKLIVHYDYTAQVDSTDIYNIIQEPMILHVGESASTFISYNMYKREEVIKNMKNESEMNSFFSDFVRNNPRPRIIYRLYKNYPTGKTTHIDMMIPELFKYTESYSNFDWQLTHETCIIAGKSKDNTNSSNCGFLTSTQLANLHSFTSATRTNLIFHKATTEYGGRIWEAWFAPDIPLNEGPYKFAGLPGLIVHVNDSQNHHRFTVTNIDLPQEDTYVEINADFKPLELSKREFHEARNKFRQNPFQAMEGMFEADPMEIEIRKDQARRNNNPIELNYR